MKTEVVSFFDENTSTLSHLVFSHRSRFAVLIDPVMDFDLSTFATGRHSVDRILKFCQEKNLSLTYILETHAHADHLSGSQLIQAFYPQAKIGIGREISKVQSYFAEIFGLGPEFPRDGSQFDTLYSDAMEIDVGDFAIRTLYTPGHTQACYTLQIGDALFTGDLIFAPDLGTGRCDFPGGDAATLFRSVSTKIFTRPDDTKIYVGHDYPLKRSLREHVTVGEQKISNLRLNAHTSEAEFVKFRKERDQQLPPPKLILPSLLINIAAGRLPPKQSNGKSYLSLPLNSLLR